MNSIYSIRNTPQRVLHLKKMRENITDEKKKILHTLLMMLFFLLNDPYFNFYSTTYGRVHEQVTSTSGLTSLPLKV